MCKESEKEQTSTTTLPGFVNTAAQNTVNQVSNLANKPFESYKGDRVADFTDDQLAAFQGIRDFVKNSTGSQEAADGARDYASAPAQSVSTERIVDENGKLGAIADYFNPFVEQALQPAIRKIQENADQQWKRIGAVATGSGALDDSRRGILESRLFQDTSTAIGDTASNFMMQAYNNAMNQRANDKTQFLDADTRNANFEEQSLDRLFRGTQSLPAAEQQQLAVLQALLGAGNQQQANQQAGLDADYQEFLREYGHDPP
jgi:hypothetical protein